jgi:hypothetical protein
VAEYHVYVVEVSLHSIKFKRNGVEFEMAGSADDVAKAWAALEPTVVASFEAAASATPTRRRSTSSGTGFPSEGGNGGGRKRTTRKRAMATPAEGRSGNLSTLLAAQVDDFPEIGETPTALYAAYATLMWASDKLEIDGLTADEIQQFLQQKLRIKNTSNAYRLAFKSQPRAVDASNTRPAVFKLMRPGERALEAYLESVQKGGTAADAEAAAQKAEEEAAEE